MWVVVTLCGLQAAFLFAYGGWCAWARQGDIDMASRAAEYALFREGIYPNAWLEQPPFPGRKHYTVYPPYAFPLFAIFFEPGGIVQGRFLIEALSLTSVVVMGIFAHRLLMPYGRPLAWVGALSGAAIAGNGTAIALGQFSILCVGLVVQQIVFLQRGKSLAAGVCWALAMLKPQIALPFLVLFPFLRQTAGGLCGVAVLVTLTGAACAWTGVPPGALIEHWGRGMSLRFVETGFGIGPGSLARAMDIDHRVAQFAAVAFVAVIVVPVLARLRRIGRVATLPVAALCSVCGMLCFYHHHYDNIMLFPLVLAVLLAAARTRGFLALAMAVLMLVSVSIPKRFLVVIPWHAATQAAVWISASAFTLWMASRPSTTQWSEERMPDA